MEEILGKEPEIPDMYVDSVRIASGLYTFVLEFGLQGALNAPNAERPPIKTLVRVRMSPQHALILGKLIRKNVNAYIKKVGPIEIPDVVYKELGISKEELS